MKKYIFSLLILSLLSVVIYSYFLDYKHTNSQIYFNGQIISMKDTTTKIEAVYVENGKIMAVGNKADIEKFKNNETELIDLKGRTLMPGFFDAHGHIDLATLMHTMTDISGINHRNKDEVWQIIKTKCKDAKLGKWLYFYGFDPILTKGIDTPKISTLDSIAPDKPIVIITKALHVFYLNSMALKLLNINKNTPDPSKASYYEKNKNGELTGAVIEHEALVPVKLKMLADNKKYFVNNTTEVFDTNAKYGITSNVLMGLTNANAKILGLYEHLCGAKNKTYYNLLQIIGMLPKRIPRSRMFIYLKKENDDMLPKEQNNNDDFYKIMGIKLWYDGSPYSGTMYLSKPYINSKFTIDDIHLEAGHTSASLIKPAELVQIINHYQQKGWQIAIHSQGDQASLEVIEAMKKANSIKSTLNFRHRLEHCMMLPLEMIEPMKKMNITASFHINHLLYYGDFLKNQVLGAQRINNIFPINSFSKTGVPYSLHADMPQFIPNPLSLASTSVNRTSESGMTINPNERVSVWQALKSITIDAAWQLHMENKLGTIEKGKYADFVILDQNPLKTRPKNLGKIKVLQTIVAENTIWKVK